MIDDGQERERDFLRRWSRRKQQARSNEGALKDGQQPSVVAPPAQESAAGDAVRSRARTTDEAPPVPPVESLDMESDYRAFFHPKIEEGLRRAALKKLFSDPHFNVMDGLDVYIDDYSVSDPLPSGMLEQLEQAKKILAWSQEDSDERAKAQASQSAGGAAGAEPAAAASMPEADAPPEPAARDERSAVQAATPRPGTPSGISTAE